MFVSVREVCDLLVRLERRSLSRLGGRFAEGLSARQLRYLDVSAVLETKRANGQPQYARLYTAVDVMLVRVWLRLLAEGVPDSRARSALIYLNTALRAALDQPTTDRALVVVKGTARGMVVPARVQRGDAFAVIPLAAVQHGVREAVAALRADVPEMWSGRRYESCSSLTVAVVHE